MLHLIMALALLGLFVWAIQVLVPMPEKFKQVINVVAIVGAVLMALRAFGFLDHGLPF